MFQLTKPFKQFPADTTVALISKAGVTAQIKIDGKSYLVPASYIHKVKATPPKPFSPVPPVDYSKIKDQRPAHVIMRTINVSCYCGKNTQRVSFGINWIDEKNVLDRVIQECPVCNTRLQQVKS